MLDLDDSGRLDPGLTVHLNGNPLIAQDGNLHCSTLIWTKTRRFVDILASLFFTHSVVSARSHLCYAVVLQFDDSGHCHLHTPKHSHNFQDLIIK